MGWYPVQNDANSFLMALVDQIPEIFRRAITGSRCKITSYLIAPRIIKRIFGNGHQFNMRIMHLFYIGGNFISKLAIVKRMAVRIGSPGTYMHFVNIHGAFIGIRLPAFFEPPLILPTIIPQWINLRSCPRPGFCMKSVRIRFHQISPIGRFYTVLIGAVNREILYFYFPDTGISFFQWILCPIPLVKFPNQGYGFCMGCPDPKHHPLRVWNLVRAKKFIGFMIFAVIKILDGGREILFFIGTHKNPE